MHSYIVCIRRKTTTSGSLDILSFSAPLQAGVTSLAHTDTDIAIEATRKAVKDEFHVESYSCDVALASLLARSKDTVHMPDRLPSWVDCFTAFHVAVG